MMLTLKQPAVHYGYRTVHDLPTPPSTSRTSPPLSVPETVQKPLPPLPPKSSPPITKDMSAPHRGLPLPAAMTLPQPNPGPGPAISHPPVPVPGPPSHSQIPAPGPSLHGQNLGALPAPPQWQGQGGEDSMRTWLLAKTEEERRKQEEEKTRQESLRLEQRKLEYDMLRTSLDRGIPPPMVPVVFAGMSGGILPQAALEWAQQYLIPQQSHQGQLPPASGPLSPGNRRDSQSHAYAPYAGSTGVPSTPGSAAAPAAGFVPYQAPGSSPRVRAHTMALAGAAGRPGGSSLPRLSTNEIVGGAPTLPSHASALAQQQSSQQDTQSPSIYFHHWQPPATQTSSTQPGTPSVDSPRKRKATGPQPAAPVPSTSLRHRSPPFSQSMGSSTLSNPPLGRRRGHSRQRSDISTYRSAGRSRAESFGPSRGMSPGLGGSSSTAREGSQAEPPIQTRSSAHSVSSMLSDQPSPRYGSEMRVQQGDSERRQSPISADEKPRIGAVPVSAPLRDRDQD